MNATFNINDKETNKSWDLEMVPRKGDLIYLEALSSDHTNQVIDGEENIDDILIVDRVIWIYPIDQKPSVKIFLKTRKI